MPRFHLCGRPRAGAVAVAFAAALLGGCAVAPPTPRVGAVARAPLAAFELAGRISASDGEHAASGRIEWSHSAAADRWTAFSPLGQIVARLERGPFGARLVTADGRHVEAADAATLLPQVLGVDAPFAQLPRWVQATPRKAAEVRRIDEVGRPAEVIDAGWQIEYAEYAGGGPAALPRRIDVRRADTHIRLVVDDWNPPALAAARGAAPRPEAAP